MFALRLKTTHRVAAVVRRRSIYHFRPFNTSSPKYKDAKYSDLMTGNAGQKLPGEDSIDRQDMIKLMQDSKENELKLDHQTKIDWALKGGRDISRDLKDVSDMLRDGFKEMDRWFIFFLGMLLLDTANSAGMFKKRSKENQDPTPGC